MPITKRYESIVMAGSYLSGTPYEIDLSAKVQDYLVTGTGLLTNNFAITMGAGSPDTNSTLIIRYEAILTGAFTVTILGDAMDSSLFGKKQTIICRFNGSVWVVKFLVDIDETDIIENRHMTADSIDSAEIVADAVDLAHLNSAEWSAGDLLYGDTPGTDPALLTVGTVNQILTSNGTIPVWQTISGDVTVASGVVAIGATKVTATMLNADVKGTNIIAGGGTAISVDLSNTADTGVIFNDTSVITSDAANFSYDNGTNTLSVTNLSINGGAYVFPTADGAASTFLQTDGGGVLSFAAAATKVDDLSDASAEVAAGASIFIGTGSGSNDDGTNFNTGVGYNSLNTLTSGTNNVAIGYEALFTNNSTQSVCVGGYSGRDSIASFNTFVGFESGRYFTTGISNTFVGNDAGLGSAGTSTGSYNVAIGRNTGQDMTTSDYNTLIGFDTGKNATTGGTNTIAGALAGTGIVAGTGNVMLGYNTGSASGDVSNKLYIDNSNTATPLVEGDFSADTLTINGDFDVTGSTTLAEEVIFSGIETIAAGGTSTVLDLTKSLHSIDSDAGGDIFTLADGTIGQIMTIVNGGAAAGTSTITPSNLAGGASVTFNAVGDSVILQFVDTSWYILGGNSYAII